MFQMEQGEALKIALFCLVMHMVSAVILELLNRKLLKSPAHNILLALCSDGGPISKWFDECVE